MRTYKLKLYDALGIAIIASGGVAYITALDGTAKLALLHPVTGAALANPVALNNGALEFGVADTVNSGVDIYGLAPGGQFFVQKVVKAGDDQILVDTLATHHTFTIPFNIADTTATTETNTGFTIPTNAMILPQPALKVTAIDATETLDVGTLSSASGDADGFLALASLGTLGLVKGSLVVTHTLGALLKVQDSANAGDAVPEGSTASAGKVITYTFTAGSDTGAGFISLPYRLI